MNFLGIQKPAGSVYYSDGTTETILMIIINMLLLGSGLALAAGEYARTSSSLKKGD